MGLKVPEVTTGGRALPAIEERSLSNRVCRTTQSFNRSRHRARRLAMARMSHWIGLTLLVGSLVGCASQEKYNAVRMERDRLAEQLSQQESQLRAAQAEAQAYKNQR